MWTAGTAKIDDYWRSQWQKRWANFSGEGLYGPRLSKHFEKLKQGSLKSPLKGLHNRDIKSLPWQLVLTHTRGLKGPYLRGALFGERDLSDIQNKAFNAVFVQAANLEKATYSLPKNGAERRFDFVYDLDTKLPKRPSSLQAISGEWAARPNEPFRIFQKRERRRIAEQQAGRKIDPASEEGLSALRSLSAFDEMRIYDRYFGGIVDLSSHSAKRINAIWKEQAQTRWSRIIKAWFRDRDVSGLDFRGKTLVGVDLSRAENLEHAIWKDTYTDIFTFIGFEYRKRALRKISPRLIIDLRDQSPGYFESASVAFIGHIGALIRDFGVRVDFQDSAVDVIDFSGWDLSRAMNLETLQFNKAFYSADTKFPEGFAPARAGFSLRQPE